MSTTDREKQHIKHLQKKKNILLTVKTYNEIIGSVYSIGFSIQICGGYQTNSWIKIKQMRQFDLKFVYYIISMWYDIFMYNRRYSNIR